MTVENLPLFDVEALRLLAGDAFARGEAYHRDRRVQILAIEPGRVLANVTGTADYRVNLRGAGETISGECACPAFDDDGFCKHMVAAALAANECDRGPEPASGSPLARIRAHLADKPNEDLVEMIVELAERDLTLFRRLEIASAADGADDRTLAASLNKAIDQATATRGFVEYGEAGAWVGGVDDALDAIDALDSRHDRLVLKLAERAIDGIESAIESIDDSNGECAALLERAQNIHIRAARAVRPDPVALAGDLYRRETAAHGYGTFDDAARLYADILGEAGLAEYRRLATEAWEKLPPLRGRAEQKAQDDYGGLVRILDRFAEHDGDVEARIALRAKDLSSSWNYLRLAEFCLAQDREDAALRWAEEGLRTFEDDRSDTRLALFAADLLVKADRRSEAEAVLRRAFERAPALDVYMRWREAGGEAIRDQALALVERRAAAETGSFFHPADLSVKILMHEKRFDMAWAMTRKHRVSPAVKRELARESEADHPREALEVYALRVDELANSGANRAYEEAAGLVARMGRLRDAAEQGAYVATLKARFGRRRNLMKLLD